MRVLQAILVFTFKGLLTVQREVKVAWEVAQVHVFSIGLTPGLCICGFALDDHLPDGDCPIDFDDDEEWVEVADDDDDWDEE